MPKKKEFKVWMDCDLLRDPSLPVEEKIVLLVYQSYADKDGIAYPTQATITAQTKITKKRVEKAVAKLRHDGHLIPVAKAKKGIKGASYRVIRGSKRPTSTYHLEAEDSNQSEPSFSGIAKSQWEKLSAKVTPASDFTEVQF